MAVELPHPLERSHFQNTHQKVAHTNTIECISSGSKDRLIWIKHTSNYIFMKIPHFLKGVESISLIALYMY